MATKGIATLEAQDNIPSLQFINFQLTQHSLDNRIEDLSFTYTASFNGLPSESALPSEKKDLLILDGDQQPANLQNLSPLAHQISRPLTSRPTISPKVVTLSLDKINVSHSQPKSNQTPIHSVHTARSLISVKRRSISMLQPSIIGLQTAPTIFFAPNPANNGRQMGSAGFKGKRLSANRVRMFSSRAAGLNSALGPISSLVVNNIEEIPSMLESKLSMKCKTVQDRTHNRL